LGIAFSGLKMMEIGFVLTNWIPSRGPERQAEPVDWVCFDKTAMNHGGFTYFGFVWYFVGGSFFHVIFAPFFLHVLTNTILYIMS
jgi:hypothetical protein